METTILEIKFPEQLTYFIAYTDYDVYASGTVDVNQEMITGQPFLYQTTNENDWLEELNKFNVLVDTTENEVIIDEPQV